MGVWEDEWGQGDYSTGLSPLDWSISTLMVSLHYTGFYWSLSALLIYLYSTGNALLYWYIYTLLFSAGPFLLYCSISTLLVYLFSTLFLLLFTGYQKHWLADQLKCRPSFCWLTDSRQMAGRWVDRKDSVYFEADVSMCWSILMNKLQIQCRVNF